MKYKWGDVSPLLSSLYVTYFRESKSPYLTGTVSGSCAGWVPAPRLSPRLAKTRAEDDESVEPSAYSAVVSSADLLQKWRLAAV